MVFSTNTLDLSVGCEFLDRALNMLSFISFETDLVSPSDIEDAAFIQSIIKKFINHIVDENYVHLIAPVS